MRRCPARSPSGGGARRIETTCDPEEHFEILMIRMFYVHVPYLAISWSYLILLVWIVALDVIAVVLVDAVVAQVHAGIP